MSSEKKIFFQFLCIIFIFLLVPAKTSSGRLNKNGENSYPCFSPSYEENIQSFHMKYGINCMFSVGFIIRLR